MRILTAWDSRDRRNALGILNKENKDCIMYSIKGKYASALLTIDNLDGEAVSQLPIGSCLAMPMIGLPGSDTVCLVRLYGVSQLLCSSVRWVVATTLSAWSVPKIAA